MLFRDVVNLIQITQIDDGGGGYTEAETPRQVFANKKSVRQSEFYQAHMSGLNPNLMFEVRSIEYNGEQKLAFAGKVYTIYRTFSKNDEIIELVCSRLGGIHG